MSSKGTIRRTWGVCLGGEEVHLVDDVQICAIHQNSIACVKRLLCARCSWAVRIKVMVPMKIMMRDSRMDLSVVPKANEKLSTNVAKGRKAAAGTSSRMSTTMMEMSQKTATNTRLRMPAMLNLS